MADDEYLEPEYHPDAHKLLDDPFYWDITSDYAPVGNDTGADVFEVVREWHDEGGEGAPLVVVEDLLDDWGIDDVNIHDEAYIALAFTLVMLTGELDLEAGASAIESIDRQLSLVNTWPDVGDRRRTLLMMRAKLVELGKR